MSPTPSPLIDAGHQSSGVVEYPMARPAPPRVYSVGMRGHALILPALGFLISACGESANPIPQAMDATAVDDASDAADAAAVTDSGAVDEGIADTAIVQDTGSQRDAGMPPDASAPDAQAPDAGVADSGTTSSTGSFSFLTYNVAGLPGVISGSDPRVNTPLISPLLNAYDLVLVQEDFAYHDDLISQVTHPHQSVHLDPPGVNFGDGLNRLSTFPFSNHARETWTECNGRVSMGSDCLTDKGFSVALHELAPGVTVEIYNVHMDAGRGMRDMEARIAQIAQLTTAINARVGTGALIVAGDTNLKDDDEMALLDLLSGLNLSDACRNLSCPDPTLHDRVMYRDSAQVTLTPTMWRADPSFVDSNGVELSDHDAIAVDFSWSTP